MELATIVAEPVEGPLTIRAIFPVFASDLRAGSASEEVIFLRPDQVFVNDIVIIWYMSMENCS